MSVRKRTTDRRVRNSRRKITISTTSQQRSEAARTIEIAIYIGFSSPNHTSMPSTPSIFSPVTLSKAWSDVFTELDQWEDVERFYALHARELNTVQGHRRLYSPKVGYILAIRPGTIQLVHHIHQEEVDDFHGEEGEIWALTDAGGTASTIVIGTRGAFDRFPGEPYDWLVDHGEMDQEECRHFDDRQVQKEQIQGSQQASGGRQEERKWIGTDAPIGGGDGSKDERVQEGHRCGL